MTKHPTPGELSFLFFLAALLVIFLAPWGTSTLNNWVGGILLAFTACAAFVCHVCATVPYDSNDMDGQ